MLSCHVLGFTLPHKTKRVRQGLYRICQFYNSVSIFNIGFKIHYKASGMTDYLSQTLKIERRSHYVIVLND